MELSDYLDYAKGLADKGDEFHLKAARLLHKYPVSVREFVTGADYLNDHSIYPKNLAALEQLNNADGLRIGSQYTEAILAGGIGVGKTSIAIISLAYQIYQLTCLKNPQALFDLSPTSEIVFAVQSPTEKLAKSVGYGRLREMILGARCFKGLNSPDSKIKSEMKFRNGVVLRPLSGATTAALGQNVLGGMLDEIAFANYVQRSTRTRDQDVFDQAEQQYNTIAKRRKSRFMKNGRLPGLLCLVSSPQHPDDLLERKLREASSDSSVYVYRERLWDVKASSYSEERFSVFVGDENRPPRILAEHEEKESGMVDEVPVDFLTDFERDIDGAIRDICGRPSLAISPFFRNKARVLDAFKGNNIINLEAVDFTTQKIQRKKGEYFQDPHRPRWVHCDLALTRDSAGLAIGHVQSFHEFEGELKPIIVVDMVLEILPPKLGEINFQEIRNLLYRLRKSQSLNIKWVSFDGYQSSDSRQLLAQRGFETGLVSMDKTIEPYECLRTAIYDGRVLIPPHVKLQRELLSVEYDLRKGKVDHPTHGSKDVADALAGVVYGLTNRRAVWADHNIVPGGRAARVEVLTPKIESRVTLSDSGMLAEFERQVGGFRPF